MAVFPKSRSRDFVVLEAGGEWIVLDRQGAPLGRLDHPTATVLRLATGERSIDEIQTALGRELGAPCARETVFACLDRLADLGLLEARTAPPAGGWGPSRRGVLKEAAVVGGLAALAGSALPAAAAEQARKGSAEEQATKTPHLAQAQEADAKRTEHRKVAAEQAHKSGAEEHDKALKSHTASTAQESEKKRSAAAEEKQKRSH